MRFENRAIHGAVKTKCRTPLPFAAVAPDFNSLIGKQFLTRLAHVGMLAIAPTIETDLIDRAGQTLRSRLCSWG
ncbi:hypothetical protein PAF17_02325 [Paracoccus sp. Z330]|uniref:EAL domain-containing protein n=1 Tax=Paracoccus onchidii TaxID=3017813 RepID=A0ABT4ZAF4_9RHOB|nr:hypothetical protein [Paracoccus onchidii]MDB6176335.1 hypothetical protein [Paracoccus onchidii]